MHTVFVICAVVGGTVLVCQFILTVLGLGDHGTDFADDVPHDLPHDMAHDMLGDSHAGGDVSTDADHVDTNWLFAVISFKTVVAAVTFFGLAGLAASASEMTPMPTLLIALAAGAAAMWMVHLLIQGLTKLNQDGTVRIERSVGKRGRVYVPIPGDRAGVGKVQLRHQERIVEYQAMTSEPEKLPTGARIVVIGVLGPDTVDVELIPETVEAGPAEGHTAKEND